MPSLYSSSRGSGGSLYRKRGRSRPYTPPKKKGPSVTGFVGNIFEDIGATVVGIPRGLYETARHPVRTGKAIGKSYAQTYGPLTHGDVGEFLHNLYEHPLGPALDVLTVVTLGAGAGASASARIASAAGRAGARSQSLVLRSPAALAKAGKIKRATGTGARTGRGRTALFRELEDLQDDAPLTIKGKTFSRNPVIRARQKAIDRMLKRLPAETPWVGEIARFGRELDRIPRREAQALKTQMRRYNRSVTKLGKDEMAALHLLGRGVSPGEWKTHLERNLEGGTRLNEMTLKVLDNPKIRTLYEKPTKWMVIAAEEARRLSRIDADEKIKRGWLTEEKARERLYLHMRIASGARYQPKPTRRGQFGFDIHNLPGEIRERFRTPDEARQRLTQLDKQYDQAVYQHAVNMGLLDELGKLAPDQLSEQARRNVQTGQARRQQTRGSTSGAAGRKAEVQKTVRREALEQAEDDLYRLADEAPDDAGDFLRVSDERDQLRVALDNEDLIFGGGAPAPEALGRITEAVRPADVHIFEDADGGGWIGGKSIDELEAEFADSGRIPLFYVPDRMVATPVSNANLARQGGGVGVPKVPVKQNRGVLFNTGRLALEPDLLGPEFLRTLKIGLFDDVHSSLEAAAVRIPKGQPLPENWQYLRRRVGKSGTERIPATEAQLGQFSREMQELLPDPDQPGFSELAERGFTTRSGSEAAEHFGYRLIVPERLARQVAGEFTRSNKALRYFIEKPTQVWRAITLGYRPAFLVNNVVGNHLLYAMRFGGVRGVVAYVNAVRSMSGEAVAHKLLRDPKTKHLIGEDFIDKHFPEFAGGGTFMRTQMPQFGGPRTRRLVKASGGGIIPATQTVAETVLRRAGVETAIRKSPQVRAVMRQMPRQERSWRAAAERAFEDDPGLVREISDQVNSALGDYLGLSAAEKTYVRAAIPFYAWYRAILTITAKMPLETPGRANLLANIGRVGAELEEGAMLPRYLKGGIPIGEEEGGLQPVLGTAGLNPYRTVDELVRAGSILVGGKPGEAASTTGSMLNPFVQGMIEQLTGRSLFSGAPLSPETGNPIQDWIMRNVPGVAAVPARTAGEVPQTSIWTGPSQLYPERDKRAQLLALLGVPVKRYSIAEARERWLREQNPLKPY